MTATRRALFSLFSLATAGIMLARPTAAQTGPNDILAFDTVQDLLRDRHLSYTSGRTVQEGLRISTQNQRYTYQVAAQDEKNAHLVTEGGVNLFVHKTADGTWPVMAFGAVGDGKTDDSAAFKAAFSAASAGDTVTVERPPNAYIVDNVTCPARVSLVSPGFTRMYYLKDSTDLAGLPVIRQKTGAKGCINFSGNSSVSGLIFDGVDRSTHGVSQDGEITGMWFFMVSMMRFNHGFGVRNVLRNSRLFLCHATGNNKGINGLVDSHVTNCEINANGIGINCTPGANDTIYTGNKVEWNTKDGYRLLERTNSNIIMGGVVDRNGTAGIRVRGSAKVQIANVKLRRNGRHAKGSAESCHIYLDGDPDQSVTVSAIRTGSGVNDGGGGDRTPHYCISAIGAPVGSLVITGSDFDGSTQGVFHFSQTPDRLKITGCMPVDDWVTVGFPKIEQGKQYLSKFTTPRVESRAVSAAFTCELPPVAEQSHTTYRLDITAYDAQRGTVISGILRYRLFRDTRGAELAPIGIEWQNVPSGIGTTPDSTIEIGIANLSMDGTRFDLRVTNNDTAQSYAINGVWT